MINLSSASGRFHYHWPEDCTLSMRTIMRDRDAQRFRFVGFYRCLDFINTAPSRDGKRPERIASFADLVSWLHAAGLIESADARKAISRWNATREGERARARAFRFRERLTEMAQDMAGSLPVSNAAIAAINDALRTRTGYTEIVRSAAGRVERFRYKPRRARQLIAPVAESAASLLCDGRPSLVRQCANPDCGLFFYDTSKTHRRRWCEMRVCGNLMKVRAFHRRRRQARQHNL